MKITISKYVSPLIASLCMSFMLPPANLYAGYLVPVSAGCYDCRVVCKQRCCNPCKAKKTHHKKKAVAHHYKRHHCYRDTVVVRSPCYSCHYRAREYVEFRGGPYVVPCGGYWADVYADYYYFASDRSTGDDDPMIDPDMNIDH